LFLDWTYIVLVLPAIIFSVWVSVRVKTTFNKYQNQMANSRLTGSGAVHAILNMYGVSSVRVERISGTLTDHFDPKTRTIRLSDGVYNSASTAAIGVAAHEVGHAMQYATNYALIKIRAAIVPVTNIGSKLSMPLILIGLLLSSFWVVFVWVAYLGIACFSLCVLFQLVTLPTEFNASKRALIALQKCGILSHSELESSKKVLWAAAMTYVAALVVSLSQLLRYLFLLNRRRR